MDKIKIAKMSDIGKIEGDYRELIKQVMFEFKKQHPEGDPSKFFINSISFSEKLK